MAHISHAWNLQWSSTTRCLFWFILGMNITGTQLNNIVPLTQDCWSQHIVRILGPLSTLSNPSFLIAPWFLMTNSIIGKTLTIKNYQKSIGSWVISSSIRVREWVTSWRASVAGEQTLRQGGGTPYESDLKEAISFKKTWILWNSLLKRWPHRT